MGSRRAAPVRQRWLLPTLLLFVLAPVALAVWNGVHAGSGTDGDGRPKLRRTGSTEVAPAGKRNAPALGFTSPDPRTYELTYDVERYDETKIQESTQTLTVRRPFDSRVVSTVAGKETERRGSRFGALVLGTGEGPRSIVSPPSPGSGDLRLRTALPDAVAGGFADVRERRRVVGIECQVYRVGSTVAAGDLVPVGADPGEHADICVDRAGLLLEEVWFREGRPLQRRVVVRRRLDPPLTDADFQFRGEQVLPVEQGNGFLRDVDPTSGFEGTLYRVSAPPAGFTYRGRVVVRPPKLNPFQSPLEDAPSAEQVSLVDTWEHDGQLLVFSQTIAAGLSAIPNDAKTARPIDLAGEFGRAATVIDLRSNELRIELPEDRFIRLAGSLPVADLVEVAKSLRAESGTGLVFLP